MLPKSPEYFPDGDKNAPAFPAPAYYISICSPSEALSKQSSEVGGCVDFQFTVVLGSWAPAIRIFSSLCCLLQSLFKVQASGRIPRRTTAVPVWISKAKLKIYASVWKISDQNLGMD